MIKGHFIEKEKFLVSATTRFINIKITMIDEKGNEVKLLSDKNLGLPEFVHKIGEYVNNDIISDNLKIKESEISSETYDPENEDVEWNAIPNLFYEITLYKFEVIK